MDQNLKKKLKRNIKLNYLNTFITNLNMQSCIWMLYLAYCGLNLTEIGIIEGMYHATSILFEIPSGALADLLGRKKSMVLSKLCITISCMIMLFSKNFWLFMLSFIIQALGNNLNSGSEEALIYDSMKYIDQEQNYIGVSGKLNIIVEIAQGIATVLGDILAEYSYFFCYSACLCIAGLAFFAGLIMILIFFLYGSGHTTISISTFMIAGFCDSVLYPIQSESLNQLIPSEQRATLISVNSMFFSIVMIIIFPIAGKIADFLGLVSMFPIIGVILLLFIIGWNLWNKK